MFFFCWVGFHSHRSGSLYEEGIITHVHHHYHHTKLVFCFALLCVMEAALLGIHSLSVPVMMLLTISPCFVLSLLWWFILLWTCL
ncbi:uncharacterized protein B0T23DRAFT_376538 [Neurospora hispaniola]|uniref:Uncharacterized protein n=1 Tax=Neurospora hispaniola TaxID=588809 RepID=A0AAJ0MSL3_9PEZI|nr:hypothetical protein B0T23DRAFT_376538 [Neurospora hispaniola]